MPSARRRGFTLIELLVVIGIIVLLAAILMPVVSRVRKQAQNAATQAQMQRILQACETYYHDFNAYPGPIANVNLQGGSNPSNGVAPTAITNITSGTVTSSENLVLGLLGFLNPTGSGSSFTIAYSSTLPPAHDVISLNPMQHKTYHYIDYVPEELSTGWATLNMSNPGLAASMDFAANGTLTDTNVPEFVDRFPTPMPILYTRAFVGTPDGAGLPTNTQQYNFNELQPYGCNVAVSGATSWQAFSQSSQTTMYSNYTSQKLDASLAVPYNDFWPTGWTPGSSWPAGNFYYANPNIAGGTRGKDGFILIGAGLDRTYGTLDDIILTP